MDIKSAVSLLEHATGSGEPPLNPFNRAVLPPLFMRRLARQQTKKKTVDGWKPLVAMSEAQRFSLAVTDVFRRIEDLGYYTNPSWFMDLSRLELQRFYMEMADIWYHRASLSAADRHRIVPTGKPLGIPVTTALVMNQRALRHHVLNTCQMLTSAAAGRSDRQLGVMYVLGSLAIVSGSAGGAYPWLVEMFSPGVTRIVGNELQVVHATVLSY